MSSKEPSTITLTEICLIPSFDDAEIPVNNLTIFRADRVQTHRGGGVVLYIKFSLKPVRLQLDIEVSPCIELCCRISTFPPQTTILAVYRRPNSNSSADLLVLQAVQHAATAPGEYPIVGDSNTLDVL